MNTWPELRVLFATSFSDACFRSIRAVAQLADTFNVDLTIAHVGTDDRETRRGLDSFFAEADHYPICRRVLLRGDTVHELSTLASGGGFDLVIAPGSDRIRLVSALRPSLRARLLKQCPVPLWTMGAGLDDAQFRRRVKTVSCLVDLGESQHPHLRLAAAFASRIDASLRVIHVIDPVDEGTLARFCFSDPPLCAEAAKEDLYALCHSYSGKLDVHIATGTRSSELRRIVEAQETDMLFVGPRRALSTTLPRLQYYIGKLPCPVVCADGGAAQFRRWSFETSASEPLTTPRRLPATV